MRVVLLTHNYPRDAGDPAGAFVHALARGLQGEGAAVTVVAPSDRGRGGTDSLDGVPVRRVRYASPGRERYAYSGRMREAVRSPAGLLALRSLHRSLRTGAREAAAGPGPAVIHAHWWFPSGLAAPPELPSIITSHGTDVRLLASPAGRWLGRRTLRRATRVTAVSSFLAEAIARTTGRGGVEVQPMPVETGDWPWSAGGGGLLAVCRLTAQKRVGLLLTALARMTPSARPHCDLVGEGPERDRLERLAVTLGLGNQVRFHGAVPRSGIASFLARADLAVQTGRDEGFGMAAVEALMAGVPVVGCRDGGGLLDILTGAAGTWLAEPTPEALARTLETALGSVSARDEARGLGQQWRRRLQPAPVARRFLDWYREAADAR